MGGFEPSTFRSESENTNHYATQAAHNKRVVYDKKMQYLLVRLNLLWSLEAWNTQRKCRQTINKNKVPPRFELGSLDSESRALTVTPWNLRIWILSCQTSWIAPWFCFVIRQFLARSHGCIPTLSIPIHYFQQLPQKLDVWPSWTWRKITGPRGVFEHYLLLAGNESCKSIFYPLQKHIAT